MVGAIFVSARFTYDFRHSGFGCCGNVLGDRESSKEEGTRAGRNASLRVFLARRDSLPAAALGCWYQ